MIILENTVAGSYGTGKQHQPVQCSGGNDGSVAYSIFSAAEGYLKGSYGTGKQHQPVQCSRGNDGSVADSIFSAI